MRRSYSRDSSFMNSLATSGESRSPSSSFVSFLRRYTSLMILSTGNLTANIRSKRSGQLHPAHSRYTSLGWPRCSVLFWLEYSHSHCLRSYSSWLVHTLPCSSLTVSTLNTLPFSMFWRSLPALWFASMLVRLW